MLLVLQQDFGERVYVEAIEKFYQALWRDGVDFTAPEISRALLLSLNLPGGPDVEIILKKAESEAITELLNRNTQEVLDQGGFGLPWIKGSFHHPILFSVLRFFLSLPDNLLTRCWLVLL